MKTLGLFCLAVSLSSCGNHSNEVPASKSISAPVKASVEILMRSPDNFLNQPVSVRGVVSKHGKAANVFMLISDEEFARCGLTNCAEFELPVRSRGNVPAIGDSVIVAGAIRQENGKFAFIATDCRRLGNETNKR